MIQLKVITDQAPVSWSEFINTHKPFTIALDGYVQGPANFEMTKNGPYANFNHHEGVDRLSTRATCAQVLIALRQELIESFKNKNGEVDLTVYVNDCDQDVCLSWFLINNYWLCRHTINPLINRLVQMEDMMDTCSGAYPYSVDMPMMKQISWIFEPYTNFRMNGQIDKRNSKDFKNIIFDVERRILEYLMGKGKTIPLQTAYDEIGGGKNWKMVIEKGFDARIAMIQSGIKAFVSVRDRGDERYTYSIGKLFNFFPININALLYRLNCAEYPEDVNVKGTINIEPKDSWGGSNTIGGSPRANGSRLKPKEVEKIINDFLDKQL